MRRPHKKKKKINIIAIEDTVQNIECFNDLECLPDHFYEDSDSVKIYREDIIYLFQDLDNDVTQHFIDKWSKEQNEDISEFCIGRRPNTNTPQDI
jgi:hypothetical protein